MSNNTVDFNAVMEALKGIKGITVSVNVRSIWVKANKKAEKALKELGFKYAASKDAWWLTYADTHVQVQAQAKAPAKKAQPKAEKSEKAASPKGKKSYGKKGTQPKAERVELPEAVKAQIIADVTRKYPGVQAYVEGTWLWLSGEKTREYKDALKKYGFFWSATRQAWHMELPADYIAAVTASVSKPAPVAEQPKAVVVEAEAQPEKAEPKAQAKPRTRKPAGKATQPVMAGLFA